MAIIQSGASSTTLLTVDPTFVAARTSDHPPEILGAYGMSMTSGALTTITGANTSTGTLYPVYGFRWAPATSTQLCMVRRIRIGFATTTAFGTAQSLQFMLVAARNWTVNLSGTTPLSASFSQTNTAKRRTVMPQSGFAAGSGQIIMSNATVLTGTSYTQDSQYMGSVVGTSNGIGTSIPMTDILSQSPGDYPLILANNEGFIISNGQTMGATGVGNLIVAVEWMEMNATTGNAIAY